MAEVPVRLRGRCSCRELARASRTLLSPAAHGGRRAASLMRAVRLAAASARSPGPARLDRSPGGPSRLPGRVRAAPSASPGSAAQLGSDTQGLGLGEGVPDRSSSATGKLSRRWTGCVEE